MTEKIDDLLNRYGPRREKGQKGVEETEPAPHDMAGDPECPICGGIGYVREDVPVGDPRFGKVENCICRQAGLQNKRRDRLFNMSSLNELSHLTFESFKDRGQFGIGPSQADSIENAYKKAMYYAQSLNGWVFFQGNYGCGKTHLAAAIGNAVVDLGIPTLFLTVPDLLDGLRASYGHDVNESFASRFEEIRRVQLLILDDFGTENATSWAQEKLFQILNFRYINKMPTVITSNLSLKEIDGRIRSRLQDTELVNSIFIHAPDFRRSSDDTGHHELSSLDLMGKMTFGNFDLRKSENLNKTQQMSLERAFQAAQQYAYADVPRGWLVFTGEVYTGKTHLAASIANYRASQGYPPLFVMVPDFLDHLRATFAPDSLVRFDRRFDEVKTHPMLILDDLGTQAMTAWVREKLYQLFTHRFHAELPTVITTSQPLYEIDRRISSRLNDTRLSTIYDLEVIPYKKFSGADINRGRSHPPKNNNR